MKFSHLWIWPFIVPILLNTAIISGFRNFSDRDLFLSCILILFLVLLSSGLLVLRRQKNLLLCRKSLILFGLTLVAAGASRFYQIDARSVWLDEDQEMGEIAGYANPLLRPMRRVVKLAATSHQSALEYYVHWVAYKLGGLTPLGVRGHSAVLGVLAILILSACALLLSRSRVIAFIVAMSALVHPHLIYYSQEGRPYMLGVACFCLFLLSFILFFKERPRFSTVLFLYASQTFLLFSLGFQPVAAVSASILLVLLWPNIKWQNRSHFLSVSLAAIFTYLPYLLYMSYQSSDYVSQGVKDWFWTGLRTWKEFWSQIPNLLVGYGPNIFLSMLCVVIMLSLFKLGKRKSSWRTQMILLLSAFTLLFPFLNFVYFASFVRFFYLDRYLLLVVPIFILSSSLLIFNASKHLVRGLLFRRKYLGWIALVPLFATLIGQSAHIAYCYGANGRPYGAVEGYSSRPEFKKVFEYAKDNTSSGDQFLLLDIHQPDQWSSRGFPGAHIYYRYQDSQSHAEIASVWESFQGPWYPDIIENHARRNSTPKQLFIVIPRTNFHNLALKPFLEKLEALPFEKLILDPSLLIFKIKQPNSYKQGLLDFFNNLESAIEPHDFLFQIYMTQVVFARLDNDKGKFLKYWHLLHNWDQYPQIHEFLEQEWKKTQLINGEKI